MNIHDHVNMELLMDLVSVTLALIIDWRCGRRLLYTHITTREKVGADTDLL